ncbi:hypothetical protein HELRODRAFT_158479 [Helobdella robusta]|uniref:Endonuclease/exonuclease/phosphatase domain-containing protein n=1 Tax=Helobdella robusta TaxID=6412 RepID=T1EMU6_HELRO|nr:hypothetical protein HELRODRAFT_158479 [Helobdella robusta]ESO12070.1 hypothetical protein HELRODRAFT_158479 [Helobdella robusta]
MTYIKDLTQSRQCDLFYHELCAGLRSAQCDKEQKIKLKNVLEKAQKKNADSKGFFYIKSLIPKFDSIHELRRIVCFSMNGNMGWVGDVVLMGDFNIHVEKIDDPRTISLLKIFDIFDLVNYVNGKTSSLSGTLDLIVSSCGFPVPEKTICPSEFFVDTISGVTRGVRGCGPHRVTPSQGCLTHCAFESLSHLAGQHATTYIVYPLTNPERMDTAGLTGSRLPG